MPINWESFGKEVDDAIETASDKTDAKLASKISSLTRLTDEEIQELFPKPADVKKLFDLMKLVKSAEDRNNKINFIVSKAEDYGGIVLTLLEKFA